MMKARAKVTAPVTPQEASPTLAEKQAALKVIEPDMMKAMDIAHDIGHNVGQMEGRLSGFKAGMDIPRSVGERRVQMLIATGEVDALLVEVKRELLKAVSKHGPMHSPHEAYGVIQEEIEEYWDEVKADRGLQASGRAELVQVAAMAIRALHDTNPR